MLSRNFVKYMSVFQHQKQREMTCYFSIVISCVSANFVDCRLQSAFLWSFSDDRCQCVIFCVFCQFGHDIMAQHLHVIDASAVDYQQFWCLIYVMLAQRYQHCVWMRRMFDSLIAVLRETTFHPMYPRYLEGIVRIDLRPFLSVWPCSQSGRGVNTSVDAATCHHGQGWPPAIKKELTGNVLNMHW